MFLIIGITLAVRCLVSKSEKINKDTLIVPKVAVSLARVESYQGYN